MSEPLNIPPPPEEDPLPPLWKRQNQAIVTPQNVQDAAQEWRDDPPDPEYKTILDAKLSG